MDLGIKGRIALVTGGSRGIGREVSRDLAREGCRVMVVARDRATIDATVEEITSFGGAARGYSADLSVLDSYPLVVEATRQAFGDPDIVVSNMREPRHGNIEEMTEADVAEAMHLTTYCFHRLVREVTPAMKARKWGRIVTIGSAGAKQPIRPYAGFDYDLAHPSRIAAVGLVKALAVRLAPYNITVNTIGTGSVETEYALGFFRQRAEEYGASLSECLEAVNNSIPAGRLGRTSEISGLTAFLCSERGGYVTGETILCDGGFANCSP
jgi:3-oxoacyl-[acyl-carrier protein] reductase